MPAELLADRLGLTCTFSNGTRATLTVADAPNPVLARELLSGLAELVFPSGTLDAERTVARNVQVIARFSRDLAALGYTGDAAGLSRAKLAEWFLATGEHRRERAVRNMLIAFDDAQGGVLRRDVRGLIEGRTFHHADNGEPLDPYSETEWERLRATCARVVEASFAAHRKALAAAERGGDPLERGWEYENVCWMLASRGPLSSREVDEPLGWWVGKCSYLAGELLPTAKAELFPEADVALAYRLLFGIYTGIVPDGIEGLGLADMDWAGAETILLGYTKGRTSRESVTLNKRAVRLLEQWLEHSALSRRFAPEECRNALWLRHNPRYGRCDRWQARPIQALYVTAWAKRLELLADDGEPLSIHRHRIRTTFESLRDRSAWFGSSRATIDPNHSPQVEGDRYLTATTAAQRDAVDSIIEQAQGDLLCKALAPRVLDSDQAAEFASRFPDLVAQLGLDDEAIRELAGGVRDVFVAACADPLSGLHGPAGKPCPARPWVCLLCPLAVFAPRHLPNLTRLNAYFNRQFLAMPTRQFLAVFGPYAQRIEAILDIFADHDAALLAAASAEVADSDDELPLRAEEYTL